MADWSGERILERIKKSGAKREEQSGIRILEGSEKSRSDKREKC